MWTLRTRVTHIWVLITVSTVCCKCTHQVILCMFMWTFYMTSYTHITGYFTINMLVGVWLVEELSLKLVFAQPKLFFLDMWSSLCVLYTIPSWTKRSFFVHRTFNLVYNRKDNLTAVSSVCVFVHVCVWCLYIILWAFHVCVSIAMFFSLGWNILYLNLITRFILLNLNRLEI
jgi:hypothetical protein